MNYYHVVLNVQYMYGLVIRMQVKNKNITI